MHLGDIKILVLSYLVLWGLQLLAWPWLFRFNKRLTDHGWAMGRVLSSLGLALLIWMTASLKFPTNNEVGLTLAFLLLLAITWKKRKKEIRSAFAYLARIRWLVIGEELLFAAGFFVYALVRGYQPDILGLEKFMDFGFIKSYLTSPTLPAQDMWWAGSSINYYSFGHFWTSILIRIWGVPASVGYNLMLAFLLASSLALTFSVVINLISSEKVKRVHLLSGLLGSLLVVLGGNSHTVWSLLSKSTLNGYWYADATRFIYNTIHEFPAYSFVVSDLHGHVLGLPVVLAFLLFFISWAKAILFKERGGLSDEVALGILLGVMAMTNTWDAFIYSLLLLIFGGLVLIRERREFVRLFRSALIVGGSAMATALFWLVSFKSISSGVASVSLRSPIWQLMVLWTIHLAITLIALAYSVLEKKTNLLVVAIALTAIALIFIPEFIYVKDIYPNHPRANTMFKLTYQAIIMMGIFFGWVFAKTAEIKRIKLKFVCGMALTALFFSLTTFPLIAFPSYFNGFRTYRGLDGFDFLKQRYPDDLDIINFLERNRGGKNMVEAVGDSYSETDFVSAFSGVPTVLGWRVHEWLWRGGYDPVGKRDEEVRIFFETEDGTKRNELIVKYNLGWVILGPREREKYPKLDEVGIMNLGDVTSFGNTKLVRIRR